MIVRFSTVNHLRAALMAGAAPEKVSSAPCRSVTTADGEWVIATGRRIAAAQRQALERFGGVFSASAELPEGEQRDLRCWEEALPLEAREPSATELAQSAVLFTADTQEEIVSLSREILRLGNDRQSFGMWKADGTEQFVLRVIGPPYFSVLRAMDSPSAGSLRGYLETAAGVWQRLGWRHPCAKRLQAPTGTWLLIDPPHHWAAFPAAALADLYEVATFTTPSLPSRAAPAAMNRFQIPLRLKHGTTSGKADMWVLRDDAIARWEEFLGMASAEIVDRLLFAVVDDGGARFVLVLKRPGEKTLPSLAFQGTPLEKARGMENLFIPSGSRLEPPVRRDVLQSLFQAEDEGIIWLEELDGGRFIARTVSESAFLPAAGWVDYVLDQDRRILTEWQDSFQFAFDEFQVADVPTGEASPAIVRKYVDEALSSSAAISEVASVEFEIEGPPSVTDRAEVASNLRLQDVPPSDVGRTAPERAAIENEQIESSSPADEALALESEFLNSAGAYDSEERREIWRRLADRRAALGDAREASMAWQNVAWSESPVSETTAAHWKQAIAERRNKDAERDALQGGASASRNDPSPLAAVCVAVEVIAAGIGRKKSPGSHAAELRRQLESIDEKLPVQTAWLAWHALMQTAGMDSLGLATARDRLLNRLEREGLNPHRDLPRFLGSGRSRSRERLEQLQATLATVRDAAGEWIRREASASPSSAVFPFDAAWSLAYKERLFDIASGRIGGRRPEAQGGPRASPSDTTTDAVHDWLNVALDWRESVASSTDPDAALPEDLRKRLDQEPLRHQTYGPHQARAAALIDSFVRSCPMLDSETTFRKKATVGSDAIDRLSREIGWKSPTANSVSARREAAAVLRDRITRPGLNSSIRIAGLKLLLEMLPGLDPAFIDESIGIILEPMGQIADPTSEALLMERTLQITSHFQLTARWPDLARHLTARLERLLAIKRNPQELEPVVSSLCLAARWMRRLGLKEEAIRLAETVKERLQDSRAASSSGKSRAADEPATPSEQRASSLILLLRMAPSVVHFGGGEDIFSWLKEAEAILFAPPGDSASARPVYRQSLARVWWDAVASLPWADSEFRIGRFFGSLTGIRRPTASDSHFSPPLLSIADAAARSLSREEFGRDATLQALLDDAEFVVRRRIHADMHSSGVSDRF